MRKSFPIWLSAIALVVPAAAEAKTVRVFAMGPKLDLAWMESRDTYRDKMFALADRTLRGPGTPIVQDGADDFASHRLGRDRDLVVWPEDIGLFAALTGERAAPARASGSLEGAIVTLIGLYGPQNQYYAERYPHLNDRVPQTRLLEIALTDTFGRVVIETFSEMADRYDVWLEAGVNMAQDWQVVCVSKATRPDCAEENPDKVERLRDPFEPGRDYAYEATTDKPSNMALVFDPDGKLVSKQVKTYLTPIELMGQLDLVPGQVSGGLSAVRTPVGTLGFVTSKDAWMPDVVQKLDQAHVDVLVQPEFFVQDVMCEKRCPGGGVLTPGAEPGMWSPDTLLASGYNAMLRHPSITTLVLPELVGNIFDYSADAQQHIATEQPRRRASGFLAGQPPSLGLSPVMPWVVPDPARPGEPFPERRARLRQAGDTLLPGSGVACPDPRKPGTCENGHVEGVLWRDVDVDRSPAFRRYRGARSRTRFSRARPLTRGRAPQRNASVARRGRTVAVAFEERRAGRDVVRVVRSRDGGRRWSRPVSAPAGSGDQWWPAVAAGPRGRLTLAWVERGAVWFVRSRGRGFGPPQRLAESDAHQWKPALAQGSRGDVVHAVFVDERDTSAEDALPQAGVWYTRIAGGRPEKARRLDEAGAGPQSDEVNAEKLNNAWAPSVSARFNRVLVTWIDFQDYHWDVFARVSPDYGGRFRPELVVNDTPRVDEGLNDSPRAALGASREFVAWTDWRKRKSSKDDPHPEYDIHIAEPGAKNVQVDPHGGAQASSFAPDICADGRGDAIVAWQDAAKGFNEIRTAFMRAGTARGPARLVNDAPRAGNAWRPQLGCWRGDVLAVWEDERDGPPRLYAAVAKARRLR